MSIADYVLVTYHAELLAKKQVAYEGHVFLVTDDWDLPNGKHVYEIWDNLSMRHHTIIIDSLS